MLSPLIESITIGMATDFKDSSNLDGHSGVKVPCNLSVLDHMPPVLSDGAIGDTHIVTSSIASGLIDEDVPGDDHDMSACDAVDCTEVMA